MTYEEIMAQAVNAGMSQEELRRRNELIQNVARHNPELAAQIARGPYRMQAGSTAPLQTPATTPSGGPPTQGSISDRARGNPAPGAPPQAPSTMSQAAARPTVSPSGTIQGPPTQAGVYPTASPPVTAYPARGEPVTNPRYEFPANATGSQQPININVNLSPNAAGFSRQGYGPADAAVYEQTPTTQAGFSRQGYGMQGPMGGTPPNDMAFNNPSAAVQPPSFASRALTPGAAISAMGNPDYPMSPNFTGPMQPSGYATSIWDANYMRNNTQPVYGNFSR